MDVYPGWTSDTVTSSERVSLAESKNIHIMCVGCDLTELLTEPAAIEASSSFNWLHELCVHVCIN